MIIVVLFYVVLGLAVINETLYFKMIYDYQHANDKKNNKKEKKIWF